MTLTLQSLRSLVPGPRRAWLDDAAPDVECSHCGDLAPGDSQHACEADPDVIVCDGDRDAHYAGCRACFVGVRDAMDREGDDT